MSIEIPGLEEQKKQNLIRVRLVKEWCSVMRASDKYLMALWGISKEELTGYFSGIAGIPDEYMTILKEAGKSHANQILRSTSRLDLDSIPREYEEFGDIYNMSWSDQPEYLKIC